MCRIFKKINLWRSNRENILLKKVIRGPLWRVCFTCKNKLFSKVDLCDHGPHSTLWYYEPNANQCRMLTNAPMQTHANQPMQTIANQLKPMQTDAELCSPALVHIRLSATSTNSVVVCSNMLLFLSLSIYIYTNILFKKSPLNKGPYRRWLGYAQASRLNI